MLSYWCRPQPWIKERMVKGPFQWLGHSESRLAVMSSPSLSLISVGTRRGLMCLPRKGKSKTSLFPMASYPPPSLQCPQFSERDEDSYLPCLMCPSAKRRLRPYFECGRSVTLAVSIGSFSYLKNQRDHWKIRRTEELKTPNKRPFQSEERPKGS